VLKSEKGDSSDLLKLTEVDSSPSFFPSSLIMHLLPDHDRLGVELNSSLATVWQGGNTPTAIRTADGALYPRRAWASVSRRTPAEQKRENSERTVLRKKWDTDKLVQAGDSSFCPVPWGDERSSPSFEQSQLCSALPLTRRAT